MKIVFKPILCFDSLATSPCNNNELAFALFLFFHRKLHKYRVHFMGASKQLRSGHRRYCFHGIMVHFYCFSIKLAIFLSILLVEKKSSVFFIHLGLSTISLGLINKIGPICDCLVKY